MKDVKDFGPYSVKNVKTFTGHEGMGFNCNLCRDGKKIAFCIDDAWGGGVDIDWLNTPKDHDDKKGWEKWRAFRDKEQKMLLSHVKSLPKVKSEYSKCSLEIDQEWFVTELVYKFLDEKEIRKMERQCKQKTFYRTPDQKDGSYYILKAPFDQKTKDYIHKKHGKDVEIFNEVFEKGGVPSVFA